jgi:hypothetical protein
MSTTTATTNKAIFVGSLHGGFKLTHIITDPKVASEIVAAYISQGNLAEALDISAPSAYGLSETEEDREMDRNGNSYVVLGTCLSHPHSLIGPFANGNDAVFYAETTDDINEWNVIEYELKNVYR